MSFEVPENLHYAETHEWIDPETGRVGITDFAQDELGDVVFVELPDEGEEISAGESFGVVESIKAVSDLYAPVDGEVTAVNEEIEATPELVNDDPYGDGWLLTVDVADGEFDALMDADGYADQTE